MCELPRSSIPSSARLQFSFISTEGDCKRFTKCGQKNREKLKMSKVAYLLLLVSACKNGWCNKRALDYSPRDEWWPRVGTFRRQVHPTQAPLVFCCYLFIFFNRLCGENAFVGSQLHMLQSFYATFSHFMPRLSTGLLSTVLEARPNAKHGSVGDDGQYWCDNFSSP